MSRLAEASSRCLRRLDKKGVFIEGKQILFCLFQKSIEMSPIIGDGRSGRSRKTAFANGHYFRLESSELKRELFLFPWRGIVSKKKLPTVLSSLEEKAWTPRAHCTEQFSSSAVQASPSAVPDTS